MQRRLTLALVGLTLFAVVLVGAGVLAFAQIGARQDTEEQVTKELEAFVDLGGQVPSLEQLGPIIRRFGQAFELTDLHIVLINESGLVSDVRRDPGRVESGSRLSEFFLTADELATVQGSEPLILSRGRSSVGIQLLAVNDEPSTRRDRQVAVLIRRDIATIPGQAGRWFLVSAALVLLTSMAVATLLARRFTAPIRAIEEATTKLASGDLTARVEVTGNDEVADLGHSVNQMALDLERSRQLEQQFLLSVSHDLRTPLTSISGYAEALVDGAIDDPARAGAIIQTHAGRLNRLVSDLLDLAKLSSNQFRVENKSIDVLETVARSVDGLIPTAEGYGLSLSLRGSAGLGGAPIGAPTDAIACCSPRNEANQANRGRNYSPAPLVVNADPDRLAQVLGNLIENAIKFAQESISVTVGLVDSGDPGSQRQVEITVTDDGPGIALDDLPHIFERLYVTQHRPRRQESSSGLGLAIVRELTQAMGGTVSAEQALPEGTAMVLRFVLTDFQTGPLL